MQYCESSTGMANLCFSCLLSYIKLPVIHHPNSSVLLSFFTFIFLPFNQSIYKSINNYFAFFTNFFCYLSIIFKLKHLQIYVKNLFAMTNSRCWPWLSFCSQTYIDYWSIKVLFVLIVQYYLIRGLFCFKNVTISVIIACTFKSGESGLWM